MHTFFEEFGQKIEAEFQELSMEMKKIFSPEQYELWETDFKARREHGPWRQGTGRPSPGKPGSGISGYRKFGSRRPIQPEPNSPPE